MKTCSSAPWSSSEGCWSDASPAAAAPDASTSAVVVVVVVTAAAVIAAPNSRAEPARVATGKPALGGSAISADSVRPGERAIMPRIGLAKLTPQGLQSKRRL